MGMNRGNARARICVVADGDNILVVTRVLRRFMRDGTSKEM